MLGDSVFNFAASGRWIYYDAKLVEHFVPLMPNLKLIIYPIGYDMPFGYLSNHYEHDFVTEENHDDNIYMSAKYYHIPYDRFPMRYTSYSTLLSGHFAKDELFSKIECDSLGMDLHNSVLHINDDWSTIHLVHLSPGNIENSYTTNVYAQEYIYYLKLIAKICTDNNIRFIAITTPCFDTYIEKTSDVGWKNIYSLIDDVKSEYPIEYFNYINDIDFRSDSLYRDCSHLNHFGADKFAKRLKQDLGL